MGELTAEEIQLAHHSAIQSTRPAVQAPSRNAQRGVSETGSASGCHGATLAPLTLLSIASCSGFLQPRWTEQSR